MPGGDLDTTTEATRLWDGQVSGRTEAAAALADRVATLTSSADGDGGAIEVTVASSGLLTGLRLDDRVRRLPGEELSGEILRVLRRAQAALVDRVAEAVQQTVGADSETGRAVLDGFARRFPADSTAADPAGGAHGDEAAEAPDSPVMPSPPPFPTFQSRPALPHQSPGVGFESGRDSRAR